MVAANIWRRPWIYVSVSALFLLAGAGFAFQSWATARDKAIYPIPGRLIDVGGRRLHLRCEGVGSPMVLMIAGAGSPSVNSYDLQDQIARFTKVCSYDRAGLGWSDPPPHPMNLRQMATDIHVLMEKSGNRDPAVLVPESFGGTIALEFATLYPSRVAGIVAIDATEPSQWHTVTKGLVDEARWRNILYQAGWRVGLVRLLLPYNTPGWADNISKNNRGQFVATWSRPMASFTHDFTDAYEQTSPDTLPIALSGMLGRKPVAVISHGRASGYLARDFEENWEAGQREWLALSRVSERTIATNNTHMIAQENPSLVAGKVRQLVMGLRNRKLQP